MNQNNSGFLSSIPPVTKNIIIINVLVWLAQIASYKNGIDLSQYLGLHFFKSDGFMPHQFFTSMFLHAIIDENGSIVFFHLFFNMFAVFMFGRTLEAVWGGKKFLIYYILTGLGAGIAQELTWAFEFRDLLMDSSLPYVFNGIPYPQQTLFNDLGVVGASGAVFGILVGFGMLFPNAKLMIIPIPIPIKAKWFVLGYGMFELLMGGLNRSGDNVAHFAHLGGLVTGLLIILFWRWQDKKKQSNGQQHF